MASDERAAVRVYVSREGLEAELAAQGLHVVTDADMAVLKAMAAASISHKRHADGARVLTYTNKHIEDACMAELARRESTK